MSSSPSVRRWAVEALEGPDNLAIRSDPVPDPLPPGTVLVRVLATTATYTDLLILRGNYRPTPPLPVSPGYDLIGVVERVSPNAPGDLRVGQRVAAMPQAGCAATHVVLPAAAVVPVRDDVDPVQAVCVVLTGVTAHQMLHRSAGEARLTGRKKAGDGSVANSIVVHGCMGGTGAMLVELAKLAGVPPGQIYGTCSAKNVRAAEERLGIVALDYGQDWEAEVLRRTGGEGVDVVFDPVLLRGYYGKGIRCLRRGGKLVAYGLTSAETPGAFPLLSVVGTFIRMGFQQRLWSFFDGKEAEFYHVAERRAAHPADFAADLRALVDLVAGGRLKPVIGKVWSFEDAKGAWLSIDRNEHHGKQIITVP